MEHNKRARSVFKNSKLSSSKKLISGRDYFSPTNLLHNLQSTQDSFHYSNSLNDAPNHVSIDTAESESFHFNSVSVSVHQINASR
jgi:hypothetical protein